MKISALLLSMLLIFLSAKPIVDLICAPSQTDACCEAKETTTQQQQSSCDDFCSIFQPCCQYLSLSVNQFALTVPKSFSLMEKMLPVYSASSHTSHSTDFWQPPKAV